MRELDVAQAQLLAIAEQLDAQTRVPSLRAVRRHDAPRPRRGATRPCSGSRACASTRQTRNFCLGDHGHRNHHPAPQAARQVFGGARSRARRTISGCCVAELTTRPARAHRARQGRRRRAGFAWDEELSELEGDAQERRLLDLCALVELLTSAEQRIYVDNGGLRSTMSSCRPCGRGRRPSARSSCSSLVIIPTLFLLLFGVSMGKQMVKVWWIGTMTCHAPRGSASTNPLIIMFLKVYLPLLVRKKLKRLVDPTQLSIFPFRTPLYEYPTTYLAQKHRGARRAQNAQAPQSSTVTVAGADGTATTRSRRPTLAARRATVPHPRATFLSRMFITRPHVHHG